MILYHLINILCAQCVDSRGEKGQNGIRSITGTPGGDFSELSVAIVAFHRVMNTTVTEESVFSIFASFMFRVATPLRPFYFHSAANKMMSSLFPEVASLIKAHNKDFKTNYSEVTPIAFPDRAPTDPVLAEIWYDALSGLSSQGCGHVSLAMNRPSDYGLVGSEAKVNGWLIEAFFRYWWPTRTGSAQRVKTIFTILTDSLKGHSMTLINNTGPQCLGWTPSVPTAHAGSTQFFYAPQAIADFRRLVLAPFFRRVSPSVDVTTLFNVITGIQNQQLGATLQLLSPANTLPLNSADITTTTSAGRRMMHVQ
jgi:hypothetical protein